MRLAFAASLALFLAGPAFAGNTSTINVGVVVTGRFASPLIGTWVNRGAERGAIYHFAVSGSSGTLYMLVSLPLAPQGRCDLRVGGTIYSFEPTAAHGGSSYEMQYLVQSAEIITSSSDDAACEAVAAAYLNDTASAESLILSRAGEGQLVDSATGAAYIRAR